MTAHNSRKASNSRNESSTVWTPPKAGMIAKTVKPATAWREANSSRDNRNITASTAEGRPIKRIPEIVKTSNKSTSISRVANSTLCRPTAQYGRQQHIMDANGTIWMPTSHEFSRKFAKKSSERRKIREERCKKLLLSPIAIGILEYYRKCPPLLIRHLIANCEVRRTPLRLRLCF
jgi:hypothetical protein